MKTLFFLFIAALILYYLFLWIFVFNGDFHFLLPKRRNSPKQVITPSESVPIVEPIDLVGKPKSVPMFPTLLKVSVAESSPEPVQSEDMDELLSEVSAEVQTEYEEPLKEENTEEDDETLIELTGEQDIAFSSGVSFEEIGQAVRVVKVHSAPVEEEKQAAQTISKIEPTDMFELVVQQDAQDRVYDLLKEYVYSKINTFPDTKKGKGFDIGLYV